MLRGYYNGQSVTNECTALPCPAPLRLQGLLQLYMSMSRDEASDEELLALYPTTIR